MKNLSDELMLGDIFATSGGKPKRVTHNTCISLDLSPWQINAFNKPVRLDIPTLELNGFSCFIRDTKEDYTGYDKSIVGSDGDKYVICLYINDKDDSKYIHIWSVYVWKNGDERAKAERLLMLNAKIEYVHQLQNLLRVCEMADFANSFKVKGVDVKI